MQTGCFATELRALDFEWYHKFHPNSTKKTARRAAVCLWFEPREWLLPSLEVRDNTTPSFLPSVSVSCINYRKDPRPFLENPSSSTLSTPLIMVWNSANHFAHFHHTASQ